MPQPLMCRSGECVCMIRRRADSSRRIVRRVVGFEGVDCGIAAWYSTRPLPFGSFWWDKKRKPRKNNPHPSPAQQVILITSVWSAHFFGLLYILFVSQKIFCKYLVTHEYTLTVLTNISRMNCDRFMIGHLYTKLIRNQAIVLFHHAPCSCLINQHH